MFPEYDVVVVGGGHAGCEAALAAGRMGGSVLLISMNLHLLGSMSCNPAMGGIGKGQIVREIDALGGYSGIVSDLSAIQFRMLNKSKGPGMWSPRTQNDRQLFSQVWRQGLEQEKNVSFWQDTVVSLIVSRGTVRGVYTSSGHEINARSVVITSGTFLNGVIHIGAEKQRGGRLGEQAAYGLTQQLVDLGFQTERLKTGTPPRVDGRTLDYTKMEVQYGDNEIVGFSYLPIRKVSVGEQKTCWITYTSEAVHDELRKGFADSPMFTGRIQGSGPRYCPSIEDKIERFYDKNQHQLFIEPEGWNTTEIYVNGFSTSLPASVQYEALRKVTGFENCKMLRPGYAIEYDYFPPTQLSLSLETKAIRKLYFAGQINGTTGYEEAACQGLLAGINAYNSVKNDEPLILGREQAYIGVLIDDLVNKGTDEPYRMFTSRAEYRTLLRQDNADLRLTKIGHKIGLVTDERLQLLNHKESSIARIKGILRAVKITPEDAKSVLLSNKVFSVTESVKAEKLLLRPNVNIDDLIVMSDTLRDELSCFQKEELEQVEIQIKYGTYIEKEKALVAKIKALEDHEIPQDFDYQSIVALGTEAKQKLTKIAPRTLGQAGRISGINPSDIQILMVYMGR